MVLFIIKSFYCCEPFEKVSKYIEEARTIAVNPCACRLSANNCDKPIDVCFSFDRFADYIIKYRKGKKVSKEEALAILQKAEDAGLVHTISNQQERPNFICNCCTDCCILLRGLTELHNPRTIAKSNFMPEINSDNCRLCETCVEWCPLQALYHHYPHSEDLSDDRIMILEERCIGCGICAHKCPHDAIKLVRVREEIPEKTGRDSLIRVETERIH
ncbi:MAG: 4Fe-4S dicluster domain-containing protein [Candidatus Jordarchaeum sp.]|uniref:4Fe-4S dicluster domain-containing protein n=1 Tax=Candidatus Jordarchaeum sp. TaxID=2823881 RepID=UPI0040496622